MSDWLRQFVRERAGYRCEYCHLPDRHPLREAFHLEHIKARQHGGPTVVENLAWACHRCNLYKGPNLSGVDPDSQETVLLFHPRHDHWEKHFVLDGSRICGITAAGRATVWLFQMNSEKRAELREELIRQNLF